MKINLEELRKRDNFIGCQKHDKLDLLVWNYNNACQFDRGWDEYTEQARGLITDLEGNIIARPFRKFFNLNETENTKIENLPNELPEITEKYDGSLGIQYYDGDKVCISTRGSFNSEQGLWATQWMERFKRGDFKEEYTYLYEIIYPENRIVIDYHGKKELILLAVKNIETGEELDYQEEAKRLGFNFPKIINKNLIELIEYVKNLSGNEEGVVVKYSNLLRVKMKGEEYVRLHRLITGFSTKSIWECLMNNQNIDEILVNIPDEFYEWVKEKKLVLETQFCGLKKIAEQGYKKVKNLPTRKEQAIEIMKNYKQVSGAIFNMLDKKPFEKNIWKFLKPKFELPFRKDIDTQP